MAIEAHEARIARRAFTIIARIPGGGRGAVFGTPVGLYLNASFDRRLFDLAVHGEPLPVGDGEVFGDGSGMAEASPIEPQLFLSDVASHYWYWSDDADRRCAEVERDGDDLLCRRVIEEVWDVETGVAQRLSSVRAPALHVVTMQRPSPTAVGYVRLRFDPI